MNAVISKRFAKRQQMQWTQARRTPAAADANARARRHAPALYSSDGTRASPTTTAEGRSDRRGVNTPQILMLSKSSWLVKEPGR